MESSDTIFTRFFASLKMTATPSWTTMMLGVKEVASVILNEVKNLAASAA
jgi:hypothetical protein